MTCEDNQTRVTEFLLLGCQCSSHIKTGLFVLFLLIYMAILQGNLLIIVLVSTTDQLNSPMFFFLKYLAFADVLMTTSIVPLMLDVIIMEERAVSVPGCLTQLFFSGVSGFWQCYLLAVMSYDRFLAILKPLHYALIMNANICLTLVVVSWMLVFTFLSSGMILISQLQFCGKRHINHFYCDLGPLVSLATSDRTMLASHELFTSFFMIFAPFAFIIVTYIFIISAIIRIPSGTGRRKTFSTCSSHLISVCAYYVTLLTVYMALPGEDNIRVNKFRSLLYILVTPLMNPFIYSLTNSKIRGALRNVLRKIPKNNIMT